MTGGIIFSADIAPEMLNLCSVTKVKVFFLVLVYVFNFDLLEFSAAILEKGLLLVASFVLEQSFRLISQMKEKLPNKTEKGGCASSLFTLSWGLSDKSTTKCSDQITVHFTKLRDREVFLNHQHLNFQANQIVINFLLK